MKFSKNFKKTMGLTVLFASFSIGGNTAYARTSLADIQNQTNDLQDSVIELEDTPPKIRMLQAVCPHKQAPNSTDYRAICNERVTVVLNNPPISIFNSGGSFHVTETGIYEISAENIFYNSSTVGRVTHIADLFVNNAYKATLSYSEVYEPGWRKFSGNRFVHLNAGDKFSVRLRFLTPVSNAYLYNDDRYGAVTAIFHGE